MSISNLRTTVAAVGEQLSTVNDKGEALYVPLIDQLEALEMTPLCIAKGGEYRSALMMGFFVGWQGAEWAEAYTSAKGKDVLSGAVMGPKGRKKIVEKPKSAWTTHANNAVDRLASVYADMYWEKVAIQREEAKGASKGDAAAKVKADREAKRDANKRTPIQVMTSNVDSIARRLEAIKNGTAKGADTKVLGDVTEALKASRELLKALKALG
jgi:hypothetical protein